MRRPGQGAEKMREDMRENKSRSRVRRPDHLKNEKFLWTKTLSFISNV